jgi:hypothetical protein
VSEGDRFGRAPASALLLRPRSSEPSQPKRAGRVSRRTLIWPFGSADLGRSRCTPAPAASTSSSSEILAFLTAVIGDNIGFAVGHSGGRLVERFGRYIPGTVLFTLRAALSETPCLLGATGRASTQRGLHQGKAKVRKDAERSAANQNGCERFDAQLADCRIDRRGATMVTGQRRRFWCNSAASSRRRRHRGARLLWVDWSREPRARFATNAIEAGGANRRPGGVLGDALYRPRARVHSAGAARMLRRQGERPRDSGPRLISGRACRRGA